jgi:glycine cleavage system aminomethyltransferase T
VAQGSAESLQAAIDRVGNAVEVVRNNPGRAFSHGADGFVPLKFTNWHSESRAWHESCGFLDQSHHMTNLYLSGPGAKNLLASLAVNTFANFEPDMAKQFVAVNPDGLYVGDAILFYLDEDSFDLVGRPAALDWVRYNAATGDWDVSIEHDPPSHQRGGRPPKVYRYELQGPAAAALMEKLAGGPLPEIKFFRMGDFTIGGHPVRVLRHGMAGQAGFELFGPWAEGGEIRDTILAAGEELGVVRVGAAAYSTANLESGWVPGPLPAIFTDQRLKAYRTWLPAQNAGILAGSLYSRDIADYYLTPYDLGYGKLVRFDHDFVGSDALRARAEGPHRKKVTLVWEPGDVTRVVSSAWADGPLYKQITLPKARYGTYQYDEVLIGGKRAGISMDCGYIVNGRAVVSLAVIDEAAAETGTTVEVAWGENPVSAKPHVEPHVQTRIRATVAPAPFDGFARSAYRSSRIR